MNSFNSHTHICTSTFRIAFALWCISVIVLMCNQAQTRWPCSTSCLCSTGGRCTWWQFWPWFSPSSSLRSTHTTSVSSGSSCARSSSARWWDTAWSPQPTGSSSPGASPQSSYRWERWCSARMDLTLYVQCPVTFDLLFHLCSSRLSSHESW